MFYLYRPVLISMSPCLPGFLEEDDADLADELLAGFEEGALQLILSQIS